MVQHPCRHDVILDTGNCDLMSHIYLFPPETVVQKGDEQ